MISLFLNSRKRTDLLSQLFDFIRRTTKSLNDIEVLIRIDHDDEDSIAFSHLDHGFNTRFIVGDRPTSLLKSYNELVSQTVGDYIFVLNDDAHILTKNWDEKLLFVDHNEIWYISTLCNSIDKARHKQYSSFPLLTRAAYEALEYFMLEDLVGLGGDVHLWRIFNEVKRIVHIGISLDHVKHRTVDSVVNTDEVALEMRANTQQFYLDPWEIDISSEVDRVDKKLHV